jgi:hypothetical protein
LFRDCRHAQLIRYIPVPITSEYLNLNHDKVEEFETIANVNNSPARHKTTMILLASGPNISKNGAIIIALLVIHMFPHYRCS